MGPRPLSAIAFPVMTAITLILMYGPSQRLNTSLGTLH
jgi:hypothetical protein